MAEVLYVPADFSTIQDAMTFETKTFGRINAISITSHGSGYESVPTVSITNDYYEDLFEPDATYGGLKGKNAAFTIGTLGGYALSRSNYRK